MFGRGILFSLAILAMSAQADILVRIRSHVVVAPDSSVTLNELVDAQAMSQASRNQLAGIFISKAPAYGEKQELSRASLMDVLRPVLEAERSRQTGRVHLVVPKEVIIDTLKHDLSSDQVEHELLQAWQPLCGDCRLEIEGLSLPRVDKIRDWSLRLKADLPKGSFSVPVDLVRENGSILPAWISGRLVTKRKVPVAKRMLNVNERVQPADVTWEYRDTTYSIDGVPSVDDIAGKRMRRGLRAGDVIWTSALERERAVRRGENVQVHVGEGDFDVTLNAVAQQDAFIGDIVSLKNAKTNTTLTGEVVGQGEVELK